MRARFVRTLAATAAIMFALTAHAVQPLQGRDINGNPVDAFDPSAVFEYDPNLNVTWLRDWNYAKNSAYGGSTGRMNWDTAMAWASSLTVGTFGGWSLPIINAGDTSCTTVNPAPGYPNQHSGYNCTGSPMGYMYYTELGNVGALPGVTNYGMNNKGPFQNVMTNTMYWSGTEYAPDTNLAWFFFLGNGDQSPDLKNQSFYAVALRAGDVAAVPEPQTWAMLMAGLGAVGLIARRAARLDRGLTR
jgi:hypothetical protein